MRKSPQSEMLANFITDMGEKYCETLQHLNQSQKVSACVLKGLLSVEVSQGTSGSGDYFST